MNSVRLDTNIVHSYVEDILKSQFTIENNIIKGTRIDVSSISTSLGLAIFKSLNENPNHVDQIEADTGKQTTFKETKNRSVRCALWMKKQGIGPNDVVIVCTQNHLKASVPVFATFFTEAIFNAWNHDITLHSARYLMELLKPKLIFTCESALNTLIDASKLENVDAEFITFDDHPSIKSLDDIMREQSDDEVQKFVPASTKTSKDVSVIFLSSGSTGFPKGVMFSGEALVKTMSLNLFTRNSSIFLSYSTFYWVTAMMWLLSSTFKKFTRIIHKNETIEDMCKMIEKYKIDSAFLPPVMLTNLSKSDVVEKYNLGSLKRILTGGSKPSRSVIKDLEDRLPNLMIVQAHGMTELARVSILQTEERSDYDTLGFITENLEAKIIDPITKETLGPHGIGELCFKTSSMMLGYYNNPEATRETIDQEGWLHSGDLCYYDEKGEFFMVDRLKEIMKYRNYQVSPAEIEEVLISHSGVMEVGVVPIPHEIDGERPMAFVKIVPGEKVTEEELVKLSSVLGENKKLWGGVRFLDDLPKTASGKIARAELKQLAKSFIVN